MGISELNAWGNPAMDYHLIQRRIEILLVASCCRNWDMPWPDGPLCSYTDFTMLFMYAPFSLDPLESMFVLTAVLACAVGLGS